MIQVALPMTQIGSQINIYFIFEIDIEWNLGENHATASSLFVRSYLCLIRSYLYVAIFVSLFRRRSEKDPSSEKNRRNERQIFLDDECLEFKLGTLRHYKASE